jgi:hypothetical protein
MICNICGKDQEGYCVEIMTGTLLASNTTQVGSTTTTKKTYSNFKPMEFWFCEECWRSRQRKGDETSLIIMGILFVISVGFLILGIFTDSEVGVLGIILGLISLIGLIYSIYKRMTTHYSQLVMQREWPITIFNEYNHVISTLVYKARGKTYYWDRKTWQDWMAEGIAPKGVTYESKPF